MIKQKMISLGFTDEKVPQGTHMCLVFTDEKERIDTLLKYLLSGLKSNERCSVFSENITQEEVKLFLEKNKINFKEKSDSDALFISGTNEVYFPNGAFEPDKMLQLLTQYYLDSNDLGFSGSRVIGEMEPKVETIKGGERLLEYESRVSLLTRQYPITAICQYDANKFNGGTIMEILKVHPKMIVNGVVVQNPFYIEPEVYLRSI